MILLLTLLACAHGDYLHTESVSFLDFVVFSDFGRTVNIAGLAGGDWILGDSEGAAPPQGFEVQFNTTDGLRVDTRVYQTFSPENPDKVGKYITVDYTQISDYEEYTLLLSRTSLRGLRAEVGGDPWTAFYVRLENLDATQNTGYDDLLITFIDVDDGTVLDEVLLY